MNKLTTLLVLALCAAGLAYGQSIPPLTAIDFSQARLSQSGPSRYYVRNVGVSDRDLSLTIERTTDGRWTVTEVFQEGENVIPADVVLDFVSVEALDASRLQIDGILYNDRILSGVLPVSNGATMGFSELNAREVFAQPEASYTGTLRNLLLGEFVDVDEQALAELRADYEARLEALQQRVEEVAAERDSLSGQINTLRETNEELEEQITRLQEDMESVPESALTVPRDEARRYVEAIEALERQAGSLGERIASLEANVTSIGENAQAAADAANRASTAESPERIRELQSEIERLTSEIESLRTQQDEIEANLRNTILTDGFIDLVRPTLTETVVTGFSTAEPQLGNWSVEDDRAAQTDWEMLFGKLMLPLVQGNSPVLYSFRTRSTDPVDEWVGVGLHLFVDNVERRGYGLGDSLLVWLTRDPEVYKTHNTYLQLYRSDDDINMGRVMDAVISDPISESVLVEVLYEPVRQYITIAVDGEEKIRYKTWFGIESGVEIALRSLGTAEFFDLEVKTAP